MQWITWHEYTVGGLIGCGIIGGVMLQNDIVQSDFNSPGGVERTVKQYIEDEFDYTEDMKWPAVAILLGFVIFLRLAVVVTTKFLNFQKR